MQVKYVIGYEPIDYATNKRHIRYVKELTTYSVNITTDFTRAMIFDDAIKAKKLLDYVKYCCSYDAYVYKVIALPMIEVKEVNEGA